MTGRITQKAFVEAMTNNITSFVGVVRCLDLNYFKSFFDEAVPDWKRKGIILEKRTCEARSKDLVFSGGSHLDLTGREFFKVDGNGYAIYICLEHWIDEWDHIPRFKSMLYLIEE